ncbi:uncharacterized protein METZ01_LOCUS376794, partial [marine metagenome]
MCPEEKKIGDEKVTNDNRFVEGENGIVVERSKCL